MDARGKPTTPPRRNPGKIHRSNTFRFSPSNLSWNYTNRSSPDQRISRRSPSPDLKPHAAPIELPTARIPPIEPKFEPISRRLAPPVPIRPSPRSRRGRNCGGWKEQSHTRSREESARGAARTWVPLGITTRHRRRRDQGTPPPSSPPTDPAWGGSTPRQRGEVGNGCGRVRAGCSLLSRD